MLDLEKAKSIDVYWHNQFQKLAYGITQELTDTNALGKTPDLIGVLQQKQYKEFCIYLSGPMTQVQFLNVSAFYEARQALKKFGVKVIMPHEIIKSDTEWLDAVIQSLSAMKEATVVCQLDPACDPQKSYGATIEALACYGSDTFILEYKAMLDFMRDCDKRRQYELDFL